MENQNGATETKIIKTFKAEVAFLLTLVIFITGILTAYYILVKQQAIMDVKLDYIAILVEKQSAIYDKHIGGNQKDHDLVLRMAQILKINQ